MKRIPPEILIATLAATAVATAALVLAAGPERRALGVAASPFGWERVIVTHALATLPLAWTLAVALCARAPALRARWTAAAWIAAGAGLACVTVFGGGFVAHALEVFHAGYAGRMAVRVAWCLLLELPWCLAGLAIGRRTDGTGSLLTRRPALAGKQPVATRPITTFVNWLAWSLVVAVVIPASFVNTLVGRQTEQVRSDWQTLRIDRASRIVRQLRELGSTRSLGVSSQADKHERQVLPEAADAMLAKDVEFLNGQIEALRAAEPSDPNCLALGQCYASLGRLAEATAVLEPVARRRTEAAVKLGRICQQEGRWRESSRWYAQAIELARAERPGESPDAETSIAVQTAAYEALARNARALKEDDAVEAYYREAIARLPSRAAGFHARLAVHFDLVGRPAAAIAEQREAARLRPSNTPRRRA